MRLQATLPADGRAALNQSANFDRLVREFSLRDEEGALGELTAEPFGPFEAAMQSRKCVGDPRKRLHCFDLGSHVCSKN